jgi:hypothetical protein
LIVLTFIMMLLDKIGRPLRSAQPLACRREALQ